MTELERKLIWHITHDDYGIPHDNYEDASDVLRERDEARAQADALSADLTRIARERDRAREALALISQHAHADEAERGFGEASRYYAIADDALAPAATGEQS